MKTIDRHNWSEVIDSPIPALVYFGANWCPACRVLKPALDALEGESNGQFTVYAADLESLQRTHRIKNYPTCLVFKQGVETARIVGVERKSVYLDVLSNNALQASPIEGEKNMTAKKTTKTGEMKSAPKGAFDWMSFAVTIGMQILAKLAELLKAPKAQTAASQGTSCENCAEEIREQVARLNAVADKLEAGTCDHACCEEVNCVQACLLLVTMKMHNCCD